MDKIKTYAQTIGVNPEAVDSMRQAGLGDVEIGRILMLTANRSKALEAAGVKFKATGNQDATLRATVAVVEAFKKRGYLADNIISAIENIGLEVMQRVAESLEGVPLVIDEKSGPSPLVAQLLAQPFAARKSHHPVDILELTPATGQSLVALLAGGE